MTISFKSLSGGKVQKTVRITSTQSWTVPSDVSEVELIICGGGGGGTRGYDSRWTLPGSGGGGSVFNEILSVTPGQSYTITIGGGGAGGNWVSNASAGSSSSFGSLFTAPGGSPSVGASPGAPSGLGGGGGQYFKYTSTGETFAVNGSFGFAGLGGGGGTKYGGNYPSWITAGIGNGAVNTGSGGYGIYTDVSENAGSGGSGICIIKYWTAG